MYHHNYVYLNRIGYVGRHDLVQARISHKNASRFQTKDEYVKFVEFAWRWHFHCHTVSCACTGTHGRWNKWKEFHNKAFFYPFSWCMSAHTKKHKNWTVGKSEALRTHIQFVAPNLGYIFLLALLLSPWPLPLLLLLIFTHKLYKHKQTQFTNRP